MNFLQSIWSKFHTDEDEADTRILARSGRASQQGIVPSEPKAEIDRRIDALYGLLADTMGTEKFVVQAGKMESIRLMRSPDRCSRVLALQRIVEEDPLISPPPAEADLPAILDDLEDRIADVRARQNLENSIERRVNEKLDKDHADYVNEVRRQILQDEDPKKESPHDARKREELERLDKVQLTPSVMELLRPQSIDEIVGQERAVRSLLAKLSSPYPQHFLLYGPPGVGKTTAARLVLEAAKRQKHAPFQEDAPFVETDGTTLRWDPRDMTNPLLGSVHDPIYQGAQRTLADSGIPEPKPGLVTEAHGGILFIDEIGEMDEMLQNKLLKVLEDKRAYFESAYYDPEDDRMPPYIRKLFEEGAPADFVLIGATTREPEYINPALRSRCAEIYFEPLTPQHIETIVKNAAEKLKADLEDGVAPLISSYTVEGRKAINILADAYSLALERGDRLRPLIRNDDVYEVAQVSRLVPYVTKKASDAAQSGHVFGLGVAGYLGSVIEIEAAAFPARDKGKGTIRVNDTAGSMAKDSVFNAVSVAREITGIDTYDYDIHLNFIGGGNIDGPSAGMAILSVIVSAVTGLKIRQDVAVTGEISLAGRVRPVGGVFEKAYGARQAGIRTLVIPQENEKDIPAGHLGLDIHPVASAAEAFPLIFKDYDAVDWKKFAGRKRKKQG